MIEEIKKFIDKISPFLLLGLFVVIVTILSFK